MMTETWRPLGRGAQPCPCHRAAGEELLEGVLDDVFKSRQGVETVVFVRCRDAVYPFLHRCERRRAQPHGPRHIHRSHRQR